jgi:hypothetical protein
MHVVMLTGDENKKHCTCGQFWDSYNLVRSVQVPASGEVSSLGQAAPGNNLLKANGVVMAKAFASTSKH